MRTPGAARTRRRTRATVRSENISLVFRSAGDTFQQRILTQNSADNFVIQNYGAYLQGAADCLDADAQQVYNGGAVIQYGCNASDPFQQWKPVVDPVAGFFLLQSVGS